MKYPRIWQNKINKKKFRVMPWWERAECDDNELDKAMTTKFKRPCKFGILMQIGYLLENEHGIWFGLNLTAKKQFKDLGEWKK